ncbi:MAG: polyphosphate polymerase domain-containing protein [Lachnospiraceae bacterium]|nr:polyphosphate polymerase domain-containing protein [Lachnospiraceae bacterium]
MIQTDFCRYEKKYLMSRLTYEALRARLEPHMQPDEFGETTVCNIYYDTDSSELIRRSIEHPIYKEKLRLRSYGVPTMDSTVFLEIKKKINKVVAKRRIPLTLKEAYDYVECGRKPSEENQVQREIDFLLHRYQLKRSIYLAYDRLALIGKEDPGFRITFDTKIRSRRNHMGLEEGDVGELLLPDGYVLMETKILGASPLWFSRILSELHIYPVSFSKYGNFYKKGLGVWDYGQLITHEEQIGKAGEILSC